MTTTIEHDGLTIEVTQEQLDRWEAAERHRAEAIADAEQQYASATWDKQAAIDAGEAAHYASLPPRDPDAPVRPVRDLFPVATASRGFIYDGLDRFNVPRGAR